MSPSVALWLVVFLGLASAVVLLALALMVVGSGWRRRLNWAFFLYAVSGALVGLGSALAHVAHWMEGQQEISNAIMGTALFWLDLAVLGFILVGPSLLWFAAVFSDTANRKADDQAGATGTRLAKSAAVIGFLAGIGLVPVIFNHWVFRPLYADEAGTLHLGFTPVGHAVMFGPLLFGFFALSLFLRHRKHVGATALGAGTSLWLVASVVAFFSRTSLGLETLALSVSIAIAGYVVLQNQILNPLRELTQQLEEQVADRTRELEHDKDRLQWNNELQRRVAQINLEIAPVTDSREMLTRLAKLVQDRLGYHHVFIYQVDESGRRLAIQASAGTTARTVLDNGHRLSIGGGSLAGQAAAEHKPCLVEDRQGDHGILFDESALPGARSEMAAPLLIGKRLLGVLDVQSIHFGAFTEEDLHLITTLADQVAVTLNNCLRFQGAQAALADVEADERLGVRRSWQAFLGERAKNTGYVYTEHGGVTPANLDAIWSPEIGRAASPRNAPTESGEGNQWPDEDPSSPILAMPILFQGQVIGVLRLRRKTDQEWLNDDVEAVELIVERLGATLENARLFEENQRRASREQLIGQVTARMREVWDVDRILETAAREIGAGLELGALDIRLGAESDLTNP